MTAATLLGGRSLWYLTRGTGIVALLLLTTSVALGVLSTVRWRSPRWPRFALGGLHRNLTLLALAFVVVHVVTTVLDSYAPVRLQDAVVPFVSRYRPVWLGLGAVAFDLLLALIVTSLLRARIGYRLWRSVHWLAYASWPVALVHALGTGSDARVGFMLIAGIVSIAVVAVAGVARAAFGRDAAWRVRVAGAAIALATPVAVVLWYESGPARTGWARRAGTPAALLAHHTTLTTTSARSLASARLPRTEFSSRLSARIVQSTDPGGIVKVVIAGRMHGGPAGLIRIELRGEPVQGGVAMSASGISYIPAGTRTVYEGSVSTLDGEQLVASLTAPGGETLQLAFRLSIDNSAGMVTGLVHGVPGAAG